MKLIFGLLFFVCSSFAGTGAAYGSCSGVNVAGYFFAYTYQYAFTYAGSIGSESHSFLFSGFLEKFKDLRPIGGDETHAIYRVNDEILFVPFIAKSGLLYQSPLTGYSKIKLCDY